MKKFLFFSLLAFAACKKTDDTPMGASNGGQSYLSCKINGEAWLSSGLNNWNRRYGVSYDRFADRITFGGDNDNRRDDLGIYI